MSAGGTDRYKGDSHEMRCPNCNKFAAYDDSAHPEIDVDLSDETLAQSRTQWLLRRAGSADNEARNKRPDYRDTGGAGSGRI